MANPRDAYVRLPFQQNRAQRALEVGGGLTFVDIADWATNVDTVAGYLRSVPLDVVGRSNWALARWGPENQGWSPAAEAAEAMQSRLTDMGSDAKLGVIVFEVAASPKIVWSPELPVSEGHGPALLARARAAEMQAFLEWGHALWYPDNYHYVLPSGKHTSSFVRLADAFQDQRAAAALATWLYGSLDPQVPTAVVMDIGTLMPLVGELQRAAERHRAVSNSSAGIGSVLSIDRYPATSLGLHRSLLHEPRDSPTLGLVSVSDSGGFAERLLSVFSALGAPSVRIEQLVSRQPSGTAAIHESHSPDNTQEGGTPERTVEDPWLFIDPEDIEPDGKPCRLCQHPRKARLVRINPRAMSALVLPEPDLIVPDVFDAQRNASLWENYDSGSLRDDAVSLIGPTGTRPDSDSVRVEENSIFFEPARLGEVPETPFGELITNRLLEFRDYPKRNPGDRTRELVQTSLELVKSRASIVLFNPNERELLSDQQWQALKETLGRYDFVSSDADWISWSSDSGPKDSTGPPETDSKGVLIFALGARTGITSQRMFLEARQRWPSAVFRCLVLHAHPENDRVWTSIRNNLTDPDGNKRLLALWLSRLPSRSPLVAEREIYEAAKERGLNSLELEERLSEIQNNPEPAHTLLGRAEPKLQAHSYFGQDLGARETLCAVGSAMQSARIQASQRGSPYWTQFDLRRVLRSYFDGLIHACILRWCEPQEAWWGSNSSDCCDSLIQLEGADFDFDLLLPELLLACAQEKLPEEAVAQVRITAKKRINRTGLDDRTRSHLRLGIDLVDHVLSTN